MQDFFILMGVGGLFIILGLAVVIWGRREEKVEKRMGERKGKKREGEKKRKQGENRSKSHYKVMY